MLNFFLMHSVVMTILVSALFLERIETIRMTNLELYGLWIRLYKFMDNYKKRKMYLIRRLLYIFNFCLQFFRLYGFSVYAVSFLESQSRVKGPKWRTWKNCRNENLIFKSILTKSLFERFFFEKFIV